MYKFRLEPVLKYRKRLEEKAQAELSKKLTESEKEKSNLCKLKDEQRRCIQDRKVKESEDIPAPDYLIYQRYIEAFSGRIEACRKNLEGILKKINEKRKLLLARSKDKKILEYLKKRGRVRYQKEIKSLEQKFYDEMTTIRFKKEKD